MGYQKYKEIEHSFLWDADQTNLAADSRTLTGVIPIFSAPADCVIKSVQAYVLTLVAGSSAEEVGDGTDVDGFLVDGFAAATGLYPLYVTDASSTFAGAFVFDQNAGATDALDVNTVPKDKLYTAADTIDFKITGTATAGKIRFVVKFMRVA
jgi:hypothetical protein